MADKNVDQLTKPLPEMIAQVSSSDNTGLDPQLIETLETQREELSTLLGKINQTLVDIDSVEHTLDGDKNPGEKTRAIVLIEIDDCRERIVEIRTLILECMKQHTELYLMVKDVSELITELKDFELDISGISKHTNQEVLEIIKKIFIAAAPVGFIFGMGTGVIGGLGIGTIATGAAVAGTATGVDSKLTDAVMVEGLPTFRDCFQIVVFRLFFAAAIAMQSLLVWIHGGVSWYFVSKWRNETTQEKLLGDIQKVCKDLKDRNILAQLIAYKDQFNVQREALEKMSSESYTELNLVMKCYRDYKRGLKEVLKDPDSGMTEEQLSNLLASQCSIPLRDRFNLSKANARQLILIIHEIMTRKQLNDS